jgi:hypothetical protein
MMYFWFIPALILLVVFLWLFYALATKRAPGRTDGRTVVDKPVDDKRKPEAMDNRNAWL